MPTISIKTPYIVVPDVDGEPVDAGYVYIGQAGLNPEANPIQVYWDEALTIPAVQPIRTINGFFSRSGTPGSLFAGVSDFSILVRNKNTSLIYSALNTTLKIGKGEIDTTDFSLAFTTVAEMKSDTTLQVGQLVSTAGYNTSADKGGNDYEIVAAGTGADDGGSFIDLPGSGYQAKGVFPTGVVNVIQFGAVQDGATDDLAKFNFAAAFTDSVYVPGGGTYELSAVPTGTFYSDSVVTTSGSGDPYRS